MTAPVPVLKNADILSTRRTIFGVFHFRPDPVVNRLIRFALALAAMKHGIRLYAFCALSNHLHISFHDPLGKHPEFRRDFHSLLTRSVNQYRGESEAKWAPGHSNAVILADSESALDHIAYVVANAPRHDLVETPEEWPGVVSLVEDLSGAPQIIRKPKHFYDPNGDLPEYVMLRFEKPVGLDMTDVEYRREIQKRVDERCQEARRKRVARGRSVVGRQRILAASPKDTAKSHPRPNTLQPRFASSDKLLRIALLLWLKSWRRDHRAARIAFEGGDRAVEFPNGTYLHLLRYGVNCSTVGPPMPAVWSR